MSHRPYPSRDRSLRQVARRRDAQLALTPGGQLLRALPTGEEFVSRMQARFGEAPGRYVMSTRQP